MNNVILYFSRSGNAKRIAGKLAGKLGCASLRITDDVKWNGFFGFMKGGYYSLTGRTTNVTVEGDPDISSFENVVLVAPLWAGGIAPAGYSYLMKECKNIRRLTVLITCDGSDPNKAYGRLEEITGPIENKLCIAKNLKNEDEIIDVLAGDLGFGK